MVSHNSFSPMIASEDVTFVMYRNINVWKPYSNIIQTLYSLSRENFSFLVKYFRIEESLTSPSRHLPLSRSTLA